MEKNEFDFETKILGPGIKLVRIPGGTFKMGSEQFKDWAIGGFKIEKVGTRIQLVPTSIGALQENPVHKVKLKSFWMGKTEVTIRQYVAFLNAVQPTTSQLEHWILLDQNAHINKSGNSYYADSGLEDHPVVNVRWYGAIAFCSHYKLRLPTEAEWEYAAGGPQHYVYPWGNEWDKNECCNNENQGSGTPPTKQVGSFRPNRYGLYDMAGNVREWCNDWFGEYQSKAQKNPQGPTSGVDKVLRGGSWGSDAPFVRCASRGGRKPYDLFSDFGFRVAGD